MIKCMIEKSDYRESEKYRSLCYKQLGILFGSPFISLIFSYFFHDNFNIDDLIFKLPLSLIFTVIAVKSIDKGYEILIRLDERRFK